MSNSIVNFFMPALVDSYSKKGTNELVVTGGQESMSNVPFIMGRSAPKYGGDAIKV